MPLTQASLKQKLKDELTAIFTIIDPTQLDKVCGAIAKAVVDEITANALVTVTGTAHLVMTGVSSAGVTGTGTVS